jgi:hypothetical protein
MPSAGFEPVTTATKRPQTYALDRAATEVGFPPSSADDFVMVKCCVFFEVRAELLNIILTSFGFDLFILVEDNVVIIRGQKTLLRRLAMDHCVMGKLGEKTLLQLLHAKGHILLHSYLIPDYRSNIYN